MGITSSSKRKQKTSQLRGCGKGGRWDEGNQTNRTRGFVRTSSTHQCHYDDIDDDRGYPPVTADDDYDYMDKNRPRNDSAGDSAFDDRGSRSTNKSIDDDVEITARYGSQLDDTAKRYDSQEARIQQMVDAFRPVIEEIIRVTEVLPYLLFLDDIDSILAREQYSPKGAAGMLLDKLKQCQEKGKWTTFLNALRTAGYEYLVNTLLGDSTRDTTDQKNILKVFTPTIINNLLPNHLIHHLFAKDVISQTDREEIESTLKNRGTTAACQLLLDRVPRRLSNWYQEFITALKECDFKFLADKLDMHEGKMYLTPTSKGMHKGIADQAPPVPMRGRDTSRAPQKFSLDDQRHSPSTKPKCHCGWNAGYKNCEELYSEKRQLMLKLMDLKEAKRHVKDIKMLRMVYERLLIEDDSDAEDTETKGSSAGNTERKGSSASNVASVLLMSSTTKPKTIDTSVNLGKSGIQITRDEISEAYAQTHRKEPTAALDKQMITTATQLLDDVSSKSMENIETVTSAGYSETLLPMSPSTCSFNRAKMYRSFKDLTYKLDITGQVTTANTFRNSMCFDSGVGIAYFDEIPASKQY